MKRYWFSVGIPCFLFVTPLGLTFVMPREVGPPEWTGPLSTGEAFAVLSRVFDDDPKYLAHVEIKAAPMGNAGGGKTLFAFAIMNRGDKMVRALAIEVNAQEGDRVVRDTVFCNVMNCRAGMRFVHRAPVGIPRPFVRYAVILKNVLTSEGP